MALPGWLFLVPLLGGLLLAVLVLVVVMHKVLAQRPPAGSGLVGGGGTWHVRVHTQPAVPGRLHLGGGVLTLDTDDGAERWRLPVAEIGVEWTALALPSHLWLTHPTLGRVAVEASVEPFDPAGQDAWRVGHGTRDLYDALSRSVTTV